jgi:hypothetical protein
MSSIRLTVAKARDLLYEHVDASNPLDEKFLRCLNQVVQRFLDSGLWAKSEFQVELSAPNGYITLPRRASALLGFRVSNQSPRRIFALAHEFNEVGPGPHEFDRTMSSVVEMSDVSVHTDLTETSNVYLAVTAGDTGIGGEAVLRGTDVNGRRLYSPDGRDGLRVTLASGGGNIFSGVRHIESLTLPTMSKLCYLRTGSIELGVYEPGEEDPSYRRYKVGAIPSTCTITALCSRRHVDLVNEDDLVIPSNIGALKHGLIALRLEDQSDLDSSVAHFDQAYGLLNAELRRIRGKARVIPTFNYGSPGLRTSY